MELRTLLVPRGKHPHPDGVQVLDEAALVRIAAAARRRGREIPVDFDHATAFDVNAPLAGAIPPSTLAVLPDGLHGTLVLNGRGTEAVRGGAYRFLSPALLHNPRHATGHALHVERLAAVALTNRPNMAMPPLTPNRQEELMQELLDKLKAALGLAADAADTAVLAAALEKLEELSEPDDGPEEEAAEQEPGEALEAAAPRDEVAALKEELARMKAAALEQEIDGAIGGGKLLPAQREWAAAYAGQDPEGFRRFLANSRPAVAMGAIVRPAAAPALAPLSPEQEAVNRMLGIGRALFDKYNK